MSIFTFLFQIKLGEVFYVSVYSTALQTKFFTKEGIESTLTLSRRRPLSYRNQSTDLESKSMDWFLYDNGLRLERINENTICIDFQFYDPKSQESCFIISIC